METENPRVAEAAQPAPGPEEQAQAAQRPVEQRRFAQRAVQGMPGPGDVTEGVGRGQGDRGRADQGRVEEEQREHAPGVVAQHPAEARWAQT